MRRYLRLYAHFLRFSFSRAMEFRVDFFFRIGMDVLWNITHITFFTVLFLHTKMLGDLTLDQVWVFMGALFVSDAIHMTVFSNNMWWFPLLVNRGDLDYYLVRPVSSLFFLSVRDFAANSFLNLLIAIGILTYALLRYPGPLSAGSILVFLTFLLAGSFLHYVTHMLFSIPVFWLQSPGGIREVYWSLSSTMGRPLNCTTSKVATPPPSVTSPTTYPPEMLVPNKPEAVSSRKERAAILRVACRGRPRGPSSGGK